MRSSEWRPMVGGVTVENGLLLPESGTRFTHWRLRSGACAAVDRLVAVAGVLLYVVAAVDSLASWPSDWVVLSDRDLTRVAAVVLFPCWPWVLVSFVMVFGVARGPRVPGRWKRLAGMPGASRALLAGAVLACAAVIAGGAAVGMAKGAARVLPGPRYEVSTLDLNNAAWTPVSAAQFNVWQARYVREDGMFMVFGLALAGGSVLLLRMHRRTPSGAAQVMPGSRPDE